MKKNFIATVMVFVMAISLVLTGAYTKAEVTQLLETDVSEASDDCTMLGVYGSYYCQAQEALDRINEIRKEACEEGNVPDPRNPERMLSADDYVPLKWSKDLESIAKIRASEAGIAYSFMNSGHDRLNNKGTFSVKYNGVQSWAEDLAYNFSVEMVDGINQFYAEKKYWVSGNPTNEVVGHYTSMINPKYKYVGFGQFYSEAAMFPGTLAAELSFEENLDETVQEAKKDVMQKIEVANQYIKEYTLEGDDEINTDSNETYVVKVSLERNSKVRSLWAMGIDAFESSDSSVATVTNDGVVTGIKSGKVTITAKSGDRVIAMKDITVKGKDISNDKNDGNSSDNNGNGDVSNDKNDGNSSDENGNGDASNDKNDGNSSDENGNGDTSDENNDKVTTVKKNYPKIGKKITVKGVKYKVTNASIKNKKYTVSCIGSASKKITKLSVPEYVSSSGFKFKVTGIENKAFYKYTKLKTVTIGKMFRK